MINLVISNKYTEINGIVPFNDIEECCRYRPKNYQFMPKYRQGVWDGWLNLYRYGKFPTGLIGKVLQLLDSKKLTYKLFPVRKKPNDTMKFIKKIKDIDLREYQVTTVDKAIEATRGIIKMPTGSGKTRTAASLIDRLQCSTLYIVHTKDLMYQTQKYLSEYFENVGILGDGKSDIQTITVALIQSLWAQKNSLKDYLNSVGMIIIDEYHHATASTWYKVIMACDAYYRFGMTGTIVQIDKGENMLYRAVTGRIVVEVGNEELIKKGFLVRPKIIVHKIHQSIDATDYAELYKLAIVESSVRNLQIANLAKAESKKGKSVLILVNRIEHGKTFNKVLPKSVFMNGSADSDDRKQALEDFRTGKTKILIGTSIFDEGIDLVNLDVVILAGGGESSTKTLQRIGRAMRPSKGKDSATIHDFYDVGIDYLEDHSKSRLRVYKTEKSFEIEIKE